MQSKPKYQQGAFLVVSLILLLVISALGLASLAQTTASTRVSQNYSQYQNAVAKARSMAQYAARILDTYPANIYPGPPVCYTPSHCPDPSQCTNMPTVCNSYDNSFPNNGRPLIAWSTGSQQGQVGLNGAVLIGTSETDSWWSTYGFPYPANTGFAGSHNAKFVVSLLGVNPNSPYENTYRIVGYASDPTGTVRATYELMHVWHGYPPDPGDGACGHISDNCYYAQCCANNTSCGTDKTSCESSTATYVPPGWTCNDYFITGLGYDGSTCTNPIAPP